MTSSFGRFAFLALALAQPVCAQTYNFTVFAGTPTPSGAADGTGRAARFDRPVGLATDSAGNVYVGDSSNSLVRKITPAGVVTTVAGLAQSRGTTDGTGASARFMSPESLAADKDGTLYVADYDAHTIRRISPAGEVTTLAGLAGVPGALDGTGNGARFRNPVGVAVDAAGNVYVADRGNRTVRKITPAGVVTTLAGVAGQSGSTDGTGSAARFTGLAGLAVDAAGNVYAAESTTHIVRRISPAGEVTTLAGWPGLRGSTNGVGNAARFDAPAALAVDAAGNVYVADTVNEIIRRIAPDGTVTRYAGATDFAGNSDGDRLTAARFFRPQGIAIDSAGNIYVSETFSHTVRKISAAGVVSTLAGPGGNFGSANGPAATAQFHSPRSLAVDADGNVVVADTNNGALRRISTEGVVTTIAGQPGQFGYNDGNAATSRLGFPYGLFIDGAHNIFFTDVVYHTLRRLTPAGSVGTLAGSASAPGGSTDGFVTAARFNFPLGSAMDLFGTVYVVDSGNHTVRKITLDGIVSTFAGLAGVTGSIDGPGETARFNSPDSVAVDLLGNVYVSDFGNSTIRKITPAGVVSTFAGMPALTGSVDGRGSAARFENPTGLAVDYAGNVFVSDTNAHIIRKIAPDGTVTTIGGIANESGIRAGAGSAARLHLPSGIAVDRDGTLYVTCTFGNVIMRGAIESAPAITRQPLAGAAVPGASHTFSAGATGGGLNYQWRFNGTPIPGATGRTFTITNAQTTFAGNYSVVIANSAGSATSASVPFDVISTANVGRITNLAIRSQAGAGAQTLIVGLTIGGPGTTGAKPVLVRGVGPTLSRFNVSNLLADPKMDLFSGTIKTTENDDWGGTAEIATVMSQVGAFPFESGASKDAAIFNPSFAPGGYSVQVTGTGGATGVALAEIYDATPTDSYSATTPRLVNVSARTQVGTGDDILIAGFVIGGQTSKTVLIRAIGATLLNFGVTDPLMDPKLELFSGDTKIDENDDWQGTMTLTTAFDRVGAFGLPSVGLDSALLVTLPPGNYTAKVSGVDNETGVALVEVYDIP